MAKNLSFKQRLRQIGLSDNEANVYLCVLEKGRTTTKEVSGETGLNHTTSYRVLKYLVDKELVSMAKEGEKKLFFSIEDPDRIREYLKDKRQELKDQEEYLDELMPSLKTVYKGHRHLKIDFIEGEEGVRWLQRQMAKVEGETAVTYEVVPLDYVHKYFPRKKNDPRNKFKGKGTGIYTSKEGPVLASKRHKYVRPADLDINVELLVIGDHTILTMYQKEIGGILIRDKSVANFFKKIITLLYRALPEENTNKRAG